jgi:hypothetical protein
MEETQEGTARRREAQLKELSARLDILEAKAREAEAQARLRYYRQIDELKKKRDNLQRRIDELREAGGGAWKDLKEGVEAAAREFRAALDTASERFKK